MARSNPVRVHDAYVASTDNNYSVEQPGDPPVTRRPYLCCQHLILLFGFVYITLGAGLTVTSFVLFENNPPPTFHLQQLTLTSFNLTANTSAIEPELSSAAWNATLLVTTHNTKHAYAVIQELILTISYIDLNLTTSPLPSFDQLPNSVGAISATASAAGKKLSQKYYGAMKEEIRVTGGLEFDVYLSGQIVYYPLIKGRKHRGWFQGGYDKFSLPVGLPPGAAAVTLLPP